MCQFYCLSNGPNTNLKCLHCGIRYCGACLYGEAGKMKSLIKCSNCGKKPRVKATAYQAAAAEKNATTPIKSGSAIPNEFPAGVKVISHTKKDSMGSTAGGIFDKLTDSSQYTGTHKHRFDSDGKGRGRAGRDYLPKGKGGDGLNALEIYERAKFSS